LGNGLQYDAKIETINIGPKWISFAANPSAQKDLAIKEFTFL
jgi:hypothetical protein